MKPFLLVLLVAGAVSAGRRAETFTGVVTDDVCGKNGHAGMQMGPTDAECTRLCVMLHDAAYALYDGTNVYALVGQVDVEPFAAQKVRVVGTLDASAQTIRVESIAAAD